MKSKLFHTKQTLEFIWLAYFVTFLGENANIFLQKPIDRCRSTKSHLYINFQLSGTRSLSYYFWKNTHTTHTQRTIVFLITIISAIPAKYQ